MDPNIAFAGTVHVAETYAELETAYRQAVAGKLPEVIPGEVFCHSLTDPSILDGFLGHLLTYFGLHTPAGLFEDRAARDQALSGEFAAMNEYFAEPIEECLARDDADNVFLCGAGARRGGGVSGIGGHNAAQAVLASA